MAETRKRSTKKSAQKSAKSADRSTPKTSKKEAKSAASRSTGKSTTKSTGRPANKQSGRSGRDAPSSSPSRKLKPVQLAGRAAEQLAELTGREPESTTAVERTDDGWRIQLEVVESRRIPDSADIMALYDVEVDSSGDLTGYRRVERYPRGRTRAADGGGR